MTKATQTVAGKADAMLANDAALEAQIAAHGNKMHEARLAAIAEAETMGAEAQAGGSRLIQLGMKFNRQVREKLLAASDAGEIYLGYARGNNARVRATGLGKELPDTKDTAKSSISAFGNFASPCVIAQGEDWFNRIVAIRMGLPAEARKSDYNSIVTAGRKLRSEKLESASNDQIAAWISKVPALKASDVEAMLKLCAGFDKFIEGDWYALEPLRNKLADAIKMLAEVPASTLVEGKREEDESEAA